MTSNLKAVLSAVGVAALLTSSAMAKTERHHQAPLVNVPADAQGFVGPYAAPVTVYAPDLREQAHSHSPFSPDFQLGGEK
jgi:hypothetical protein